MDVVTSEIVIPKRDDFPRIFKEMGYKKGAEVGVLAGDFSIKLVNFGGTLFLVDAWKHIEGFLDMHNPDDARHEEIYQGVKSRFSDFSQVKIRRGLSIEVARTFEDGELDWVYFDADHRQEFLMADLRAWFPKVKAGGMFCGHDYFDSPGWENHMGVKAAVDHFFRGKKIGLTTEYQYEHSWWTIKE